MFYKLCLSFCLQLICFQIYAAVFPGCACNRTSDSLVLVKIYQATDGNNWFTKWNLHSPINTWFGIVLDAQGCVKSVVLPNNNLSGTLPKELSQLRNLSSLFLFNNRLSGNIPEELSLLLNLEDLVLEGNQIVGFIPESLGLLTQLRLLNLGNNQLLGPIPNSIFHLNRLQQLILSNNQLVGSLSHRFSQLRNLTVLDLSYNQFSGSIPPSFSQLTNLREIYLQGNRLSGNLPAELSELTNLVHVWLFNNQLTGAVPDFRRAPLNSLRIEKNKFDAIPDFSGMRSWGNQEPFGLVIYGNLFTFEDLLPLQRLPRNFYFDFDPQDSVYVPPILYVPKGSNYTLRLGIDQGITENNYKWFKDTSLVLISNRNTFEFINVSESDEGFYSGRINNPGIPDFFLNIAKFRVVVSELEKCNKPLPGNLCVEAPSFCSTFDLHNYCSVLGLPDINIPQFFLCDSLEKMDNAKWLSFAAPKDSVVFEIFPQACLGVIVNGQSYSGLQASIWSGCGGIPQERLYCISDCQEKPFYIGGDKIKKGELYYIALDGCAGDVCDFQIKVLEGKSGFELEEIGPIQGSLAFCPDTMDHIYSVRRIPGAKSYHWSIDGNVYQITADTFVNVKGLPGGTYKLSVYAKNECDSTNPSFVTFRIFPTIIFAHPQIKELGFDSAYTVTLRWTGGIAPFTVTKGVGTIDSVRVFRSAPIPCKQPYTIEITDAQGCAYSYQGQENCGCNTFAGTMPNDTLNVCDGQTIFARYNNDEVRDSGDVSTYILYTNPDTPVSSIIKNAPNGIIPFDPSRFRFNLPYYLSRASSRALNGAVNFSHPCLSISLPQVVYFRPRPLISAGPDRSVCDTEGELSVIGNFTSGRWVKVSGPGNVVIETPENPQTRFFADSTGSIVFAWEATNGFCTARDEIVVTVKQPRPVVIEGKLFVCEGQSTKLDAGPMWREYFWNNGKQTRTIQADTPGVYCVTVLDADGCRSSACVQVNPSTPPIPELQAPDSLCTGATATLALTESYEKYQWNTGHTTAAIEIDTGGRYCVTVTAENGCTAVACDTVIGKPRSYSTFRDTVCFNQPYFYLGKTYNSAGKHLILYPEKGRDGCDSVHQLILTWHPEIFVRDSIIIHDTGQGNGSIFLRMGGGKPPYTYLWSNGKTTQAIDELKAGAYTVVVTDANNCVVSFTFIVRMRTAAVDLNPENMPAVLAYPNPVKAGSPLQIKVQGGALNTRLEVFHIDGRRVYSSEIQSLSNEHPNVYQGNFSLLLPQAGIYFLLYTMNDGSRGVIRLSVIL